MDQERMSILSMVAEGKITAEEGEQLLEALGEDRVAVAEGASMVEHEEGFGDLSLDQLMEMIPGFNAISRQIPQDVTEGQMKRVEAIINSMTLGERQDPQIINASRKRRIAAGSGTTVQDVNALLTQFRQTQRMMKQFTSGRGMDNLLSMFR